MAATMMMVMFGLVGLAVIGVGLIVLRHVLKKKEAAHAMETVKTIVIPEMEAMTNRMLENSMDMVLNKSVEITKKMMEAQYE